MTIRHPRLPALLVLAGAALAASMALADSKPFYNHNQAVEGANNMAFTTRDSGSAAMSPPTVTGLDPQSGEAGVMVRIQGANLSGVTKVIFNDSLEATFNVVSDNEIKCTVPAGARPGPIKLATPDVAVETPVPFTVAYE